MTRFLIVNLDYPEFLHDLYASHPGLEQESYDRQLAVRNETLFGSSDFYPRNLNELGHPAIEVHINNRRLQETWAREHGMKMPLRMRPYFVLRRGSIPWIKSGRSAWMGDLLRAQVEDFKPDVIISHSLSDLPATFWKSLRGPVRLLVGQIASPLADDIDLSPFDLMVSSLPNYVERFRQQGRRAELVRLAFDPIVLERLGPRGPSIDVSFVGSLSLHHQDRIRWLESICRRVPVDVWGPLEDLPKDSPILKNYRGTAWGLDMYRILQRSRITLNFHIGIAGPWANNMRLYEATGVGTLLLTDWKQNLVDMFEPGKEVAVYRDADECVARIGHYLAHESERETIAAASQARTLRDHTYLQRMRQLVEIVEPLL